MTESKIKLMNVIKREIQTAVVTGPTGVVGQALCRYLLCQGIRVYAVCRPGSDRNLNLPDNNYLQKVLCDISNINKLPELIEKKADAFFHLAWTNSASNLRNNMMAQIDNIKATLNACHTAKRLGCVVFIGAGSQAEYGRVDEALKPDTPCYPENGYGMAKLCAGQMSRMECAKLDISHVWPRILSVYGPHDGHTAMITQAIKKLLVGESPSLTAGEQVWDYLYENDVAEALYRLAVYGQNGYVYPVGSGKAKPLKEYLLILRDAIDSSIPLGFGDVPYSEKQVMHLEADISAIREDTGFVPRTDFEEGIRKTIAYYRNQGDLK